MEDFAKARLEKDLAELKKLIDNHFAQRKKDEEELDVLKSQIDKRKDVRAKQIEERARKQQEKMEREKEEKIREEEEAIKRKAEEEAKKKEAMAAMSMNYSGFMAKKQAEARNRRGGADKEKKKKILAERRKALNVDHMDGPKLQEKAQELWKWLYQLEVELIDVQDEMVKTKYWLNTNRKRYNDNADKKQTKKRR